MLPVHFGRRTTPIDHGFLSKTFGLIGRVFISTGMPIRSVFFAEFQRNPEKHAKILANRALRREIKRILNTDWPYSAPAGLLEPKPEPMDEEALSPHEFMYRRRGIFDEGSG